MRIGAIGYATEQGLGHLMKWFYDNGVTTDPVIFTHNKHQNHFDWYPAHTPRLFPRQSFGSNKTVSDLVDQVQVFLFFETPFDWSFISLCRQRGVKTVLVPMYEWTPREWPVKPDAVFCPSKLDQDYFQAEFPTASPYLPIPVDHTTWQYRTCARRWLHNAGNIGHREHKGTRQLLEAVPYVKSSEWRLTVRAQDSKALQSILEGCPEAATDKRVTIENHPIPYANLFNNYDVYIAPEKFNGLSLPLREAYAAGLLVQTTDRYPHNTWLSRPPLIHVSKYQCACISRNYREFYEAIVDPKDIAAKIDSLIGSDISGYSIQARQWANDNSWEKLKPVWLEEFKAVVEGKPCTGY